MNKVLLIAYFWLTKTLNTAMMTQVGVSTATITNWANHLRCLVTWDIENLDLAAAPIGEKESSSKLMNLSSGSESITEDTELKAFGETPLCR